MKLWDIASGKELDEPPGHWYDAEVMAFGPDGKTIAVATPDGTNPVPGRGDVAGARGVPGAPTG